MPPQLTKQQWRAWAKALSKNHSQPLAQNAGFAQNMPGLLQQLFSLHNVKTVLAYKAFGTELGMEGFVIAMPAHTWLTTRISGQDLNLHLFSLATIKNDLGIFEPSENAERFLPSVVDAVLVPGLCFDFSGTRLGRGAGFYDRFLPKLKPDCLRIGVVSHHSLLPAHSLPAEPHDVPMTHVMTESKILVVKP